MTAEELHYEELAEAEAPALTSLPESPFSLSWRMLDGHGCDVQITMRHGVNREVIAEVMGNRKAFMDLAQKAGWQVAAGKPAPQAAAPSNGVPPPAASVPAPATPAPAVPANVAGGSFGNAPRQSFVAVRMEIAPRGNGKSDVKLYAAGHQYPDITVTKTPAELAIAFAKTGAWTAEHFNEPKPYEGLSYVVEYTLSSKLNSKGNPYKDLADVRPA